VCCCVLLCVSVCATSSHDALKMINVQQAYVRLTCIYSFKCKIHIYVYMCLYMYILLAWHGIFASSPDASEMMSMQRVAVCCSVFCRIVHCVAVFAASASSPDAPEMISMLIVAACCSVCCSIV